MTTFPTITTHETALSSFGTSLSTGISSLDEGDVIALYVGTDGDQPVTSVTSTNATWIQKANITNGSGNSACSFWWAPINSGVSSVSVDIEFSSSFDDSAAIIFNVRGCNPASPFDPYMGLPYTANGNPPGPITYSTTNENDLLIYFRGGEFVSPLGGPPAGWDELANVPNSGGFGFMGMLGAFQTAASPQSSVVLNDDSNIGGFACLYLDAFTPALYTPPQIIKPKWL